MMRFLIWSIVIVCILGGAAALAYKPATEYIKSRSQVKYQTKPVSSGTLTAVVESTGTIEPVLKIDVGAFVSGPILDLLVDFNDPVKKDQVMARIDPRLYVAAEARELANLATRKAEIERIKATLQQAKNDYGRALKLRNENPTYISDAEMDQYRFGQMSLEAQLLVAEAGVQQAQASLENAQANVQYTEIKAPVDGIVIDRKIGPGQTLASQFQAPVLFIVAPEMEKRMFVYASVDEADIGQVKAAQLKDLPVQFTVDAYPSELFTGRITQIRMSSTTLQNVVTYPVVVEAPNPEKKLMPGMTANITFQVEVKENVLRVPNAALRFYPRPSMVRLEDRKLLEGEESILPRASDATEEELMDDKLTAAEEVEAEKKRIIRHVWVKEGNLLRAVEVVTGISDHRYTEIVSGDLKDGVELIVGEQKPL